MSLPSSIAAGRSWCRVRIISVMRLLAAAPCWNRCHAALERSHQKKFQRAVPSSNLFMSFVPKQAFIWTWFGLAISSARSGEC
eukprot:symbB.v1.2.003970.t1/scaffold170.1/size288889/16